MCRSRIQQYVKGNMRKRWWLFSATDFQSLMYPCFTISRILGIFPYKLNGSTFVSSKPHYIISTMVVCVCCVLDLLIIYGLIITKMKDMGKIKSLEAIGYCTMSCFTIIITHVLSGPRMRLIQTIMEISSKLSSESYKKMSRFIHFKDTLGFIFLVMQMCIYFPKNHMYEVTCVLVIITGSTIYLTLLQFQMHMLYINCVCVLKACFKNINDNLAHMQRLMISDTKSHSSDLICRLQRSQFSLKRLKTLEKQHLMVSDTVEKLNIIFSVQLLATVVMSFCAITCEAYAYLVYWQDGIFINITNVHFLVALSTTIAYYIIKISFLVWACETGKKQAQKIKTTVHDLLNSTNDEQIKNELQIFSLQLLHRENIFSAKGLTMDAKLFAVIINNITTYLVILVQFLHMSHSCDKKTAFNVI